MTRPTLRDVANRAGVSRTTVSFVLNDNPTANIPAATRDRVRDAAASLNYRPNASARALRTNRTLTIGFLSDEIASGTYAVGAIQGAQDSAWKRERLLLVVNTGGESAVDQTAAAMMVDRQVDGVVYASYTTRLVDPPLDLDAVPTVLLNCYTQSPRFRSLLPDEYRAGRHVTESLLAAGHRRIAFINGPSGFWAAGERLRGYLDALREHDVPVSPGLLREGDWWPESAAVIAAELLAGTEPPTAYLCANDRMALGCYEAVRRRGLKIPQDVSVVGFDNQEIAAHSFPPLTSVRLPDYEMGARAIEILLQGDREALSPGTEQFPCEYIQRGSSAALPSSARPTPGVVK